MRTLSLLLLLVLLALPANANLIVNGGFETGDFSGWTVTGANILGSEYGTTTFKPNSGTYAAWFGAVNGNTDLSQTFGTIPGQVYEGSFWVANTNDGNPPDNLIQVLWNGDAVVDGNDVPDAPWTELDGLMTATAASTTITFVFHNAAGWFDLDDVSVEAVPEPAAAFLCAAGCGMAALKRRR